MLEPLDLQDQQDLLALLDRWVHRVQLEIQEVKAIQVELE